jgi:sialidase-1
MFKQLLSVVMMLCVLPNVASYGDQPRQSTAVDVFVAGIDYPNYRSPALTVTPDGTLVAIALGRTGGEPGYGGDNDLVMKRSFDGGATWSALQVIEKPSLFGEKVNNPMVVLDETTDRLWVLYNRYEGNFGTTDSQPGTTNNTAWARYSDDSGASWSNAIDITMGAKDFNTWNTIAFGPGSGIQTSSGRLIVPSARWQSGQGWSSYVVYSDDHGVTWQRSALAAGNFSNENNMVELANGQIRMDARPNTASAGPRINFLSTNGGSNWGPPVGGQTAEAVHSAAERYTLASAGDDLNRIVWTSSRGPGRVDLIVRTSYDEGSTYTNERVLFDGYSGYSDLTVYGDKQVGVLFETNQARNLTFTSFNQAFIEPPDGLLAYDDFRYQSNALLGNKNGGYGFAGGWAADASLSGLANPIVSTGDLAYTDFPFAIEGNRRPTFFNNAGGTMSRALATPLDLAADESYYFSLLVRQDNVASDEETTGEQLEVAFLNGSSKIAQFGVQGNEAFFVENAGTRITTTADTLVKGTTYYLVGKIEASASSFDQVFLSAFASGEIIPDTESNMAWTLVGTTTMDSSSLLNRLLISAGNQATWVLDELRIGTNYIDVVSNTAAATVGDLDGDGFVGIADLNIVLGAWNEAVPSGNPLADPSGDGFVGIEDLNIVLGNWNTGTPPVAAVPEPSAGLFVLALGALSTSMRKRAIVSSC